MPGSRHSKTVCQPAASEDSERAAEAKPDRSQPYPRAGVIVDQQLTVLEFLGSTGRYLQLPVGRAHLNLTVMLNPGMEHAVLEAVRLVRQSGGTARKERLTLASEDGVRRANIEVTRIDRHPSGKPVIRVLFEEAERGERPAHPEPAGKKPQLRLAERRAAHNGAGSLKDELLATRATLESIIEEQEVGTARLKSAYYQLESVNAELEEANEELAAANSELAALNDALAETIRARDAAEQERRLLQAEVIQAQRLEGLRVMAGGVAHDFNNLLTSIVGNASVLLEELPRESMLWDAAEQIDKAGTHASGLVKQMLAFCGKGAFTTERVDLSALVRESVDLLRASIGKTAELRCDLGADLPAIEADVTQMRQVLINLVVNASEAIGGVAGVVRVSTRRLDVPPGKSYRTSLETPLGAGGYVCLEVADSGCGMSRETKARLFDPFFSTKFTGRGLGLAAVLGIVRGHQGSIQVHSRPSQGSEIEILFPAASGAVDRSPEPKAAAERRGCGTVLVVDDEESIRSITRAALKRAGLDVITASDGEQALAILRRDRANGAAVGAVLLDLVMPHMDGRQVLQQMRAMCPGLPVILSSGYCDEGDAAGQLHAGGPTSFLAKPYRPTELVDRVFEVLSPRANERRA